MKPQEDANNIGITILCAAQIFFYTLFYFKLTLAGPLVALAVLCFLLCVFSTMLLFLYSNRSGRLYASLTFLSTITIVLMLIVGFAGFYRFAGIVDASSRNVTSNPIDCLYFSIVTFTTLGYGDFYPVPEARLIAAFEAIIGYVSLAALIAALARFLVNCKNQNRSST